MHPQSGTSSGARCTEARVARAHARPLFYIPGRQPILETCQDDRGVVATTVGALMGSGGAKISEAVSAACLRRRAGSATATNSGVKSMRGTLSMCVVGVGHKATWNGRCIRDAYGSTGLTDSGDACHDTAFEACVRTSA